MGHFLISRQWTMFSKKNKVYLFFQKFLLLLSWAGFASVDLVPHPLVLRLKHFYECKTVSWNWMRIASGGAAMARFNKGVAFSRWVK